MNHQLLTQAIFAGKPIAIKFAVIDIDGEVLGFEKDPRDSYDMHGWIVIPSFNPSVVLGQLPAQAHWQHSLIARVYD